jgi:uncharacterized protein (TIGR02246 family)
MDASQAIACEEIRQLVARYNHAGDRGRLDELVACFAEDGVMELPDLAPLRGRAAIRDHLEGVVALLAASTTRATLRHHVASLWIELDGDDAARASAYFSVYTEIGLDHWGGYRDTLRRREGRWLFARRKVRVDGAVAGSRMLEDGGP